MNVKNYGPYAKGANKSRTKEELEESEKLIKGLPIEELEKLYEMINYELDDRKSKAIEQATSELHENTELRRTNGNAALEQGSNS